MHSQQTVDRDFHATYSGSGIHRLLAGCYGSVRLAKTVPPPPPSPWQAEGTAAHAALEQRLGSAALAPQLRYDGPVGVVTSYVDSLPLPAPSWEPGSVNAKWTRTEHRVVFPQSIVPAMECSGTLDVMVASGRRAWIIDYKHGAGEFVDVEENAQLMFYAWAALHGMLDDFDEITLVIIQPNCSVGEPIREYRTNALELFEFSMAVQAAIEQAERAHAPLKAGPHCKFCPAGPVCDVREADAIAVMTGAPEGSVKAFAPADLPKPQDLDLARLGAVVTKAGAIRSWLKTVEDYAEARALAGEIEVPGCKVVEAPARRKWIEDGRLGQPADSLLMLLPACDIDHVMPRKLIGITEAEKLVVEAATRGIESPAERRAAIAKAKEAFSALTIKESSGALSLVPLSDARPPVNRAAKHFGGAIIKGFDE
jgi:hypothetical protein